MKKADPRHAIRVVERNRPYDTFGWGVVFSDNTMGNLEAADRRDRRRDQRRVQSLGRHRRPLPRHDDHLGRPRLLRHRPQAAAQHPAEAVRGARRRAGVRDGRHRRRRRGARLRRGSRHRLRRHQQPDPHPLSRGVRARRRRAALPLRLARDEAAVQGVHVRVRRDRARLVPGARVPVRRRHLDVHRGDARGGLAAGRARADEPGRGHRVLRAAVRALARRPPAHEQRVAPARVGDLDQVPARRLPVVGALDRRATACRCRSC